MKIKYFLISDLLFCILALIFETDIIVSLFGLSLTATIALAAVKAVKFTRKKQNEKLYKRIADDKKKSSWKEIDIENIVIIDTETTGLKANDEILDLSILSGTGEVLFSEYIKPSYRKTWADAERIHHISPKMVADSKTMNDYKGYIAGCLNDKIVVGYNVSFDLKMIQKYMPIRIKKRIDVMEAFAPIFGEWDSYHEDYRWQKLSTCADYYHYDWGEDEAHDSLADCNATLYCFNKMRELEDV